MPSYIVDDNVYPNRSCVFISTRYGNNWYTGSGVIVGNNDILTASHVIYNESRGGLPDETRIYPSYNPSLSNTYYQPLWFRYYDDWDANGDNLITAGDNNSSTLYELEKDIALLSLDTDVGSIYGWMGLQSNFSGGNVEKLGHGSGYNQKLTYDSGNLSLIHI